MIPEGLYTCACGVTVGHVTNPRTWPRTLVFEHEERRDIVIELPAGPVRSLVGHIASHGIDGSQVEVVEELELGESLESGQLIRTANVERESGLNAVEDIEAVESHSNADLDEEPGECPHGRAWCHGPESERVTCYRCFQSE